MKLPPGWVELDGRSFQREDLLLLKASGPVIAGYSKDRYFEITFLKPAGFDADDEEAFNCLERTLGAGRTLEAGWLAAMLKSPQNKHGLSWCGRAAVTSELLFEIDRLFRRRDIFVPFPDVHREHIRLLEQQVADLKQQLGAMKKQQ